MGATTTKGRKGEICARDVLRYHGCTAWRVPHNDAIGAVTGEDLIVWLPGTDPDPYWPDGNDRSMVCAQVKYGKSYPTRSIYNAHENEIVPLGVYAADPSCGEYGDEVLLWGEYDILTGSIGAWLDWRQGMDVPVYEIPDTLSSEMRDYVPRRGVLFTRRPYKPWLAMWRRDG